MKRLFIALSLPQAVAHRLSLMASPAIPGVRWVSAENYHITLRFLGNVDDLSLQTLKEALKGLRWVPFDVSFQGVGLLKKNSTYQLWMNVGSSIELNLLYQKIGLVLKRLGFLPATRKFFPHVTLAKFKSDAFPMVKESLSRYNSLQPKTFPIDAFTLYASQINDKGSNYTPIQVYGFRE